MDHVDVMMLCCDRLEYTKLTLPNLLKNTFYPDWKLWIADNGSTDGTTEFIQRIIEGAEGEDS